MEKTTYRTGWEIESASAFRARKAWRKNNTEMIRRAREREDAYAVVMLASIADAKAKAALLSSR
jgi:hypothetical protein